MKFKRLLSFLNKLFSLDRSHKDIYYISDDDIKEFFKHLRMIGKREYTMAYFYKWHREYRENLTSKG